MLGLEFVCVRVRARVRARVCVSFPFLECILLRVVTLRNALAYLDERSAIAQGIYKEGLRDMARRLVMRKQYCTRKRQEGQGCLDTLRKRNSKST